MMKSSSRALQRQLDLATAVCQERLLAAHVRHVLAMVDLVADRLPFDDALDIYVRVLRLGPEEARNVGSRALAELGRRERSGDGARPPVALVEVEDEEEEPLEAGEGRVDALFARLKRRVRGRVQEDLRHRISLVAARTEDDLLETHVGNALVFARTLAKDGSGMTEPDAIELYVDTMMLPEGMADVVYHRALRRIADEVLPPVAGAEVTGIDEAERDIGLTAKQGQA